jgi:hypothetical protein
MSLSPEFSCLTRMPAVLERYRHVNILLTSHRFFPDIGGTETVAELLAEQFSKAGHTTVVVTQTLGAGREAAYEDVPKESTLPLEIGGSAGALPCCEPGDPKSFGNAILESGAASRPMDGVAQHLARHDPEYVANEYLKVLKAAIEDK